MKNFKSILFLILTIQSCVHYCDECDLPTNLIVENQSSYDMVIKAYYKGKQYDEIKILSKKSFSKNVDFGYKNKDSKSIFMLTDTDAHYLRDSIVIIFDNKRVIKQYCNGAFVSSCQEIENNLDLFAVERYKTNEREKMIGNKRKYLGSYKVTFTDTDYTKALDL